MERLPVEGCLLWVEDNEITRQSVVTALAHSFPALTVVSAKNGAEGLELFRRHHPDLILTDLDMPRMNGIQMAREIRRLGFAGEIIMVTARSEPELNSMLGKDGINYVIAKPILLRELLIAVAQRLPSSLHQKLAS
ncbi:response regulator [Geomesophilobacter sediminis]|uniref:Response regulator n=1 Tax=Geomesophilobacter sediminis TaxID=2798584 RepID=A0A8J7J4B2_9BACT|nr:response regulator [Geomesophilobacter sediminis]MBJ6725653.1 response regulator [Geomesophilobacter sediminis]